MILLGYIDQIFNDVKELSLILKWENGIVFLLLFFLKKNIF